MIKYKKILAQLLAASMVFTSLAVPVSAAETDSLTEEAVIEETVAEEEANEVVSEEETIDEEQVVGDSEPYAWSLDFYDSSKYPDTTKYEKSDAGNTYDLGNGLSLYVYKGKDVTVNTATRMTVDGSNRSRSLELQKFDKLTDNITYFYFDNSNGNVEGTLTIYGVPTKARGIGYVEKAANEVYEANKDTQPTFDNRTENLANADTNLAIPVKKGKKYYFGFIGGAGYAFKVAFSGTKEVPKSVTVSFNGAKEGNVVFDLDKANAAGKYTLSANQIAEILALTVDGGYKIVAWTDGTNEIDNDADSLADLAFESGVTYTPVTSQTFSVKFVDIDDAGKTETVQVYNGSKTPVADIPKAEKTMKKFTGWTVGTDTTLLSSTDVAKKVVTADITYKANYEDLAEAPHDTADLVAITGKAVFTAESFIEGTDLKEPTTDDKGIKKWTFKKWKTNMVDDTFQFVLTNKNVDEKTGMVTGVDTGAYLQTYKDTDVAFTDIDNKPVDAPANISRRLVLGGATFSMDANKELLSRGLLFKTSEPGKIRVYWSSASDLTKTTDPDAKLGLFYAKKDGTVVEIGEGAKDKAPLESLADPNYLTSRSKGAASLDTMTIPAAGEYAIGGFKLEGKNTNAIIYRIEVITDSYEEPVDPTKPDDPTDPSNPESTDNGEVDTFDAKGDPVLSAATAEKVSANYAKLAAGGTVNGVQAAIGDTGVLNYEFKKPGKVKAITISTNSVSDCRVTVNAKAKVVLPAAFTGGEKMVSATPVAVSGNSAKLKALKANKKGVVSLKAFKGCAVYDVTFTNSKKEKITIRVVNLAFDKAIKKIQMSASQNLIVRPTMLYDNKTNKITEGAGFLNGVWSVGKTPITKPGTVPDEKTGAKVTLSANGIVTVTGLKNKGSLKLTYTLNGRKYTTALKVQKKKGGAEVKYEEAGLLK